MKRIPKTSEWSELATGPTYYSCSCLVPPRPSIQQEPSYKQAYFVCPPHDCFLKMPHCFYLFMLNTEHFVSCWFPFMQVNSQLNGFPPLSGIHQLSHLDGISVGLHLSSDADFPRSMVYSVKVTILWTTKVLFPQGKFSIFPCAQLSFEVETKDNFERKTQDFENTFLSKLPELFMLGKLHF